jgi:phosphoglycolate phosphatase-like HAD superfamily hydrolase
MLLAAMRELRLDPARSWLVGDSPRDTHAGLAAGLDPRRCLQLNPELPDLPHAADLILNHADR